MKSEILAEVIRGETVESIHRGHLIILDGDGEMLFEIGDPEIVTFFRSASKALQLVPCLTSGAAKNLISAKGKSPWRALRIRAKKCTRCLPPKCSKKPV